MTTQWQYRRISKLSTSDDDAVRITDSHGESYELLEDDPPGSEPFGSVGLDGWEMVGFAMISEVMVGGIVISSTYWFKRPIE